MKTFTGFVVLWLNCAIVFAGTFEAVIAPPDDPPTAGQEMIFFVYIHNSGDETVEINIPETICCRLQTANQIIEATGSVRTETAGAQSILPRGFIKVLYAIQLPNALEGVIQMDITEIESSGIMFSVLSSKTKTAAKSKSTRDASQPQKSLSLNNLFSLYQPYLGKITSHEPMYFLVGTNPEESKFQVSVKYRFINPGGRLAEKHPWVNGFHFGYTQTSFWDLGSNSAPFKDTSYKPELFFASPAVDTKLNLNDWLFIQSGVQHESNGRNGNASRSTNYIYVKPVFLSYDSDTRWGLMLSPRIWAYIHNDNDTNPDLSDYRGYFDLEIILGRAESYVLGSHFRWAKEGPSMQLDLTYPLHRFLKNFDLYFQVQYVNTLAESLLDYTDRTEAVRIGFALSR